MEINRQSTRLGDKIEKAPKLQFSNSNDPFVLLKDIHGHKDFGQGKFWSSRKQFCFLLLKKMMKIWLILKNRNPTYVTINNTLASQV